AHAKELTNPRGSAGKKSVTLADEHFADVHGMKSIDVLRRMDAPHHGLGIDLIGQRSLHKNAVNPGVGVELIYLAQKLHLLSRRGQPQRDAVDSRLLASLSF